MKGGAAKITDHPETIVVKYGAPSKGAYDVVEPTYHQ